MCGPAPHCCAPKGQAHGAQVAAAEGCLGGLVAPLQQPAIGLEVQAAQRDVKGCRAGQGRGVRRQWLGIDRRQPG